MFAHACVHTACMCEHIHTHYARLQSLLFNVSYHPSEFLEGMLLRRLLAHMSGDRLIHKHIYMSSVCAHTRLYMCIESERARMHSCMYGRMYAYMYVPVHANVDAYVYVSVSLCVCILCVLVYARVHLYVYVNVHVYAYVYMYVYMYVYRNMGVRAYDMYRYMVCVYA